MFGLEMRIFQTISLRLVHLLATDRVDLKMPKRMHAFGALIGSLIGAKSINHSSKDQEKEGISFRSVIRLAIDRVEVTEPGKIQAFNVQSIDCSATDSLHFSTKLAVIKRQKLGMESQWL